MVYLHRTLLPSSALSYNHLSTSLAALPVPILKRARANLSRRQGKKPTQHFCSMLPGSRGGKNFHPWKIMPVLSAQKLKAVSFFKADKTKETKVETCQYLFLKRLDR